MSGINLLRQLQELQRVIGSQPAVSQTQTQTQSVLVECAPVISSSAPSSSVTTSVQSPVAVTYAYKVRIINPTKKSEVKVRLINHRNARFKSVTELRRHLADEFEDMIPASETFDVGFMEGSQQAQIWLENSEDLNRMYKSYPNGGNITFWCYGTSQDPDTAGVKRKRDNEVSTRRQDKEEEVDKDSRTYVKSTVALKIPNCVFGHV